MKNDNISDNDLAALLDGNLSSESLERIITSLGSDRDAARILRSADMIDRDMAHHPSVRAKKYSRNLQPMCFACMPPKHNTAPRHDEPANPYACELLIMKQLGININNHPAARFPMDTIDIDDVGTLAEQCGLSVNRLYHASLDFADEYLARGYKLLAVVDEGILHHGYANNNLTPVIIESYDYNAEYLTIIDAANPGPIPLPTDKFLKAWQASSNYLVAINRR